MPPHPNPTFPTRPFSSTLHSKHPERPAPSGFGASSRETARLERERQERERQQQEAALQAAAPSNPINNLTDEQREEVNEAFSLFDLDKDSKIDYHEFKVALKALGFDLPKSEIMSLLTTHGTPPENPAPVPTTSGPQHLSRQAPPVTAGRLLLTLPAFQTIAAGLIAERDPREEILRAFALFDSDDKGKITIDDLRRVATELGERLEEDELVAMIEEFDLDGKGGVGRDEFVQICWG